MFVMIGATDLVSTLIIQTLGQGSSRCVCMCACLCVFVMVGNRKGATDLVTNQIIILTLIIRTLGRG